MSHKIQELRKHVQSGNLELARLDQNNQPIKMQISELQQKTNSLNKNQQIYQLIRHLSWEQKFEWVNTRRLKGNLLFKTGEVPKAIETYVESLIGLQLNSKDSKKNHEVKFELQFPILMNIATCFYKLKEYQRGIDMCDQVIADFQGAQFYQAFYKKAYFLFELGQFDKSKYFISNIEREILVDLSIKLQKTSNSKKISKNDVKQLLSKILSKTKQQKNMYKRIFFQEDDDLTNSTDSMIELPVLIYEENLLKRSANWVKEVFDSCFKAKDQQLMHQVDEEKYKLLKDKKH